MNHLVNVNDYRRRAEKRLPRIVFDYLDGGALDETTLRANSGDLAEVLLRQRVMRDVGTVDVSGNVLGYHLRTPFLIAPMGLLTLFRPGADVTLAQAAQQAGTVFVHSAWSGTPLGEVAAAAPGRVWAQLSFWRTRDLVDQRLEAAAAAGVDVLVVAGDVAASSKRERDLHNGFGMTSLPRPRAVVNAARKPWWVKNLLFGGKITFGDQNRDGRPLSLRGMYEFMDAEENPSVTWADISDLRSRWPGKIVLKGVMTGEDTLRAIDCGVDAVYVSNHGGRQFDGQSSTVSALEEVAAAAADHAEVLVDGGIRRGADAVKLAALGASACLIGRPAVYGLVQGGLRGASTVLNILTEEAKTACAFVGESRLAAIRGRSEVVRPVDHALSTGESTAKSLPTPAVLSTVASQVAISG